APSDHVIPDAARFRDAVQAAAPTASAGQLVTFGIRPDRAETGYGWLELSTPTPDFAPQPQPLRSFVEKPDLAKAETLMAGGMHLWNTGIFLFSTTAILEAFATHAPEVLAATRAAFEAAEKDLSFTRLAPAPWADLIDISIDYAAMEHAPNLSVVPYAGASKACYDGSTGARHHSGIPTRPKHGSGTQSLHSRLVQLLRSGAGHAGL
ncbi:MAG: hypothetical protein KDD73_16215, partial [Anaerolineales bacterium]|nr:hypothetical protein [Anaerolineales bacterium]